MRKLGLFLATCGFALAGGLEAADAAVTLVSVDPSSMTGIGFSQVATFNSLAVGTKTPFADGGMSFTGSGIVVKGNKGGVYAAPTGDTSNYLVTNGKTGAETITFGKTEGKLGLYWGSPDRYNVLSFFLGGTLVGKFTGNQIEKSAATSAFATFAGPFDKVEIYTGGYNFEVDNISVSGIPELATWMMMLMGFGGLGLAVSKGRRMEIAGWGDVAAA